MSTLQVGTIKSASSAAPVFQNSSGTEIGSLINKAVKFSGFSGTLLFDKGISSITDNGTGDYTVNFDNAFSNADYAYTFGAMNESGTTSTSTDDDRNEGGNLRVKNEGVAASTFRVQSWRTTNNGETANDVPEICIFFIGS
mgnify:CR=1 FL=1|tara:strand:- start:77 stop:499 length:423 start_codon:yes stop_codon:yes gene_type:complete